MQATLACGLEHRTDTLAFIVEGKLLLSGWDDPRDRRRVRKRAGRLF